MTAELTKALCGFHRDVSTIHKEARGNFGAYADLATVLSTVLPALAKNGLAVVQTFQPGADPGEQILVTSLLHSSGERIDSHLPLTVPKGRNPLHDWGGATTYSRRYALLAILSLAAGIEDDDGDGATAASTDAPASHPMPKPPSASKPVKSTKPAAAADPSATPLSDRDRKTLITHVTAADPDVRSRVVAAFKSQFGTPADQPILDYIKTQEHFTYLMQQLQATPQVA